MISENERLRGDLAKSLDDKALAVAAAESGSATSNSSLALLREENELLRQVRDSGWQ